MENKRDIPGELETLSPLLAGFDKVNVFSVPDGYFDGLSETVIHHLNIFHSSGHDLIDLQPVPAGYFEQLPALLMNRIRGEQSALEETKGLSELLYSVQDKNVFEVPQGYFDHNPASITGKISESGAREELRDLSPLLYNLAGKNVYNVPADYFNHLPETIVSTVTSRGKLVQLSASKNLWKYAVAAMMTGIFAFGVYKYSGNSPDVAPINVATVKMDASIEEGIKMDDRQFTEAMQTLSETDIVNYLETHGDITDIAALRNTVDEEQLPDREDYLLNENTLENYLDKIQISLIN